MKRRGASESSGSLDMLLDTMCNTFGGVCFIALMVAIISAALPKSGEDEGAGEPLVTEGQVIAKEVARLEERRDQLKESVRIQSEFVKNANTNVVLKADVSELAQKVAANEGEIGRYEKLREEYLDELAKLKTRTSYSRREAMRLERLLGELKDKTGRPLFDRHRVVRTPKERELQGLKTIDVWLHERRLYMLDDKRDVRVEETGEENGKQTWKYYLVPGRGVLLDDDFFLKGSVWPELERRFDSKTYVRIFVDTKSFDELCLFRDALISRNSMLNWIVREDDVLYFIEGYDGHVQ